MSPPERIRGRAERETADLFRLSGHVIAALLEWCLLITLFLLPSYSLSRLKI
jgi:hypothetical protein